MSSEYSECTTLDSEVGLRDLINALIELITQVSVTDGDDDDDDDDDDGDGGAKEIKSLAEMFIEATKSSCGTSAGVACSLPSMRGIKLCFNKELKCSLCFIRK